jgi:hypothetical protein
VAVIGKVERDLSYATGRGARQSHARSGAQDGTADAGPLADEMSDTAEHCDRYGNVVNGVTVVPAGTTAPARTVAP